MMGRVKMIVVNNCGYTDAIKKLKQSGLEVVSSAHSTHLIHHVIIKL